ncbi:MAG TPA: hypothetical protein VMV90_04685 [Rectinemataceae bacterium]|nr:hypothetical protein [Rectinemataceae bacterium]
MPQAEPSIGFRTNGFLMDRARAKAPVAAGLDRAVDALGALGAARAGLGRLVRWAACLRRMGLFRRMY